MEFVRVSPKQFEWCGAFSFFIADRLAHFFAKGGDQTNEGVLYVTE